MFCSENCELPSAGCDNANEDRCLLDVQGCPVCYDHLAHIRTHAEGLTDYQRTAIVLRTLHELRPANHCTSGHQIARPAAPALLSPCQWTALATSNAASFVESTERLPRKQTRCSKADECRQEAAACLHQHSSRTCSWRQLFIRHGCPSQVHPSTRHTPTAIARQPNGA